MFCIAACGEVDGGVDAAQPNHRLLGKQGHSELLTLGDLTPTLHCRHTYPHVAYVIEQAVRSEMRPICSRCTKREHDVVA